ncbi:TonB-dependent siderophore receptor [Sphingobium chlorophenolicum]|uniref:TonB-dependent siderophore receptor n=1 Tax=Sphingobium chlorophenolicum TaxID=46429 RepID=A0A081RAG1_SPHCR|nr:TonB-dependent siderophore receptor [Sphingobium chlorophenolicum]KEQ52184.1 TonB-dependent siderophore receptor precursor [Sphingobium chlorophenolicum]
MGGGNTVSARRGQRTAMFSAVLMATTAIVTVGAAPSAAAAQTTRAEQRRFDIPSQSLAQALMIFGRQAGLQVTAEGPLVSGRTSAAINGDFSPAEALSRILQGTGLTYRFVGNGGVQIEAAPQVSDGAMQLGPVRVEANGTSAGDLGGVEQSATSPVAGYAARRSATATKTDTPIQETPQSISIVTAEQVRDQKAQTLQDALGYTAGVMVSTTGMNPALADSFWIRGFQADPQFASFYRDGLRFGARIFNGKQEPYGLERIEVLKGPSSILYGATAPGGIVNTVSKRPTLTPIREVNLEYGSFNRKQVSADFSGPFDADGRWAYRLTVLGRDSDTFIDYGRDDRIYVAPSLSWNPTANTSLTLLAHYQHQLASDPGSLPVVGTLRSNANGRLPRSRYLGEPDHNDYDSETKSIGYEFRQSFTDTLTFNQKLRYMRIDLDYEYTLLSGVLDATQRRAGREPRHFVEKTNLFTVDNNLTWTVDTGPLSHTVLAGIDYSRTRYNSVRDRGTLPSIDIFAPVYGAAWSTPPWRWFIDTDKRTGVYLQDQMKLSDKLVVLLGGRYDWFSIDSQTPYTPAARVQEKERAFTGRAGLVYLADNGLAPYLSFSQSFEPTSGRDRLSNRYDPSEGEQYEAGLRYQPPGSDISLSGALYQLTRTNVQTPDPVDPSFSVQTGEVRSRGLELEAKGELLPGLKAVAAYTYTDTKVTKSNNPAQLGTRFLGVPRHMASLWADYDFRDVGLAGFNVGGGVRYVAERPGDLTGGLPAPAYTLFDAVASYSTGPWRLAVNVRNLTDKVYIPNNCRTTFAGGCDYGAPRSIIATLGYSW